MNKYENSYNIPSPPMEKFFEDILKNKIWLIESCLLRFIHNRLFPISEKRLRKYLRCVTDNSYICNVTEKYYYKNKLICEWIQDGVTYRCIDYVRY